MMQTSQPIRVLHLFANLNLGGAESRIMDLYRSQNSQEVINDFVIMTDQHCHFTDEVINTGGSILTITDPRKNLFKNIIDLYRLLSNHPQYHALHAHTSYYSGIAVFVAYFAGIKKRVTHARNKSMGNQSLANRMLFALGRFLSLRFATTRFAISQEAGEFLYGNSQSEDTFEVVPNAFRFDLIQHVNADAVKVQRELNAISDDKLNLVLVARFYPVKNHTFLLNIVAKLKEQQDNFCLHLIGDGDLKEKILVQASTLGITDNLRLWGKRNDVAQLLSLFDVMVMPSISEGLGVAALEAQAAGLPCVLSSNIPAEADIKLGMCQFIDLNSAVEDWIAAILAAAKQTIPTKTIIDKAFTDKGYMLSTTRERYREAYQHDR